MPTGYTAHILEDDYDFKKFAMVCARAFGACVEMRDEPLNAPIPEEFKPSDYHVKALEDARAEVARLSAMTTEERKAFGEAKKAAAVASYESYIAKEKVKNAKLLAVRMDVERWTPPTPEHVELKSFMLVQIDISLSKCSYWKKEIVDSKAKLPIVYFKEALHAAKHSISYHTDEQAKEEASQRSRTQWVKDLRQSLNDFPVLRTDSNTAV